MIERRYVFSGVVLGALCIFVFIGYTYYKLSKQSKENIILEEHNTGKQITRTQKVPSNFASSNAHSSVDTALPIARHSYQPTETEKLLYRSVVEAFKPIQVPNGDGNFNWTRETFKAFPPRELYPMHPEMVEQYNNSVNCSRRHYQDIIINLNVLIKQTINSLHRWHFQETFALLEQMQKEDELFYDKYEVEEGYATLAIPDVIHRGVRGNMPDTFLPEEKINSYIHCLRYSYFHRSNNCYTMEFGDGMRIEDTLCKLPILTGAKLMRMSASAVPALLDILNDRRPIIAVDNVDSIPTRFYRYQDAAVEILQRMFSENLFPIQLAEAEYFSGYLEKQTPEMRQQVIQNIKDWVQECLNNPPPAIENTGD